MSEVSVTVGDRIPGVVVVRADELPQCLSCYRRPVVFLDMGYIVEGGGHVQKVAALDADAFTHLQSRFGSDYFRRQFSTAEIETLSSALKDAPQKDSGP